jgi:hypothetical protein
MAADSIHHIYVGTHNWGKSVAFWRALGFELEEDRGKTSALLRPRGGDLISISRRSPLNAS